LQHDGGESVTLSAILHALTKLYRQALVARSLPAIQPTLERPAFLYTATPAGARLVLPPQVYRADAKFLSTRARKAPRWAEHAVTLGQLRLMTAHGLRAIAHLCTPLAVWRDRQLRLPIRIPARPSRPSNDRALIPDLGVLLQYAWGCRPWFLELELTHKNLARLEDTFLAYASLTNDRRDALAVLTRPHTAEAIGKPLILLVARNDENARHLRRCASIVYKNWSITGTRRPDMWFTHLDMLRDGSGQLITPAAFFTRKIARDLRNHPGVLVA
jgi:hypothetical protein